MSRCQYTVGNGWHGKGRLPKESGYSERRVPGLAAEYASDCHRAVERYHWSDIIRRDHGCNQSLCSWFFYAINRLVRALSYLQKKGDFYHGICTCYVCHILGADTASCGNRSCVDHERGVFFAVCWNSGWRSVLFRIQF